MSHLHKPRVTLLAASLTLAAITVGTTAATSTQEPRQVAVTLAPSVEPPERTASISRSFSRLVQAEMDAQREAAARAERRAAREARQEARERRARLAAKREAQRIEAEKVAAQVAVREAAEAAKAAASLTPGNNRELGRRLMVEFGFGPDQWAALERLWTKESGWNHRADNPSSSAFGIPQALPGSKMSTAGADWATNPATQIRWGLGYIRDRYGSPAAAMAHSDSVGWY